VTPGNLSPGATGSRRPSVVALGGGHGLSITLSAVSRYASDLTAVVSAADDGGSSGRLREWWEGPAPGDVRRCLLALAGTGRRERLWAEALDHRFASGELAGHSLGNLVLVGLTETTGDFVAATAELAHLLGVKARILPATSNAVQLCAEIEADGGGTALLYGQAKVAYSGASVRRVWLRPPDPLAPPEVLAAIAAADQVVLGPGSLFTSVLAVCAVPGIRKALADRAGGRVYVCNLRPQDPETAGYDADAHLAALRAHDVPVDVVVCDPSTAVGSPSGAGRGRVEVVTAAVAGPSGHSHDPALLAGVLEELAARLGPVPR
jgi:uncharacterized cofD-like protein